MAKGSVRKKGKKWYFRFYVEDESGNRIQKEMAGTDSKSETEALLRKAMEAYETQQFVTKRVNITLGDMLDMWVVEDLKPSGRSNGTERSYIDKVNCIKKHPISKRKLKTVTAEHLQDFFDSLRVQSVDNDGNVMKARTAGTAHVYAAALRGAFRFAVFPKKFISFNPMEYVVLKSKSSDVELFVNEHKAVSDNKVISAEQYHKLITRLSNSQSAALLPVQISYYTGLRLGETCGLTWQDIDLEEQCLTVRRSMNYNNARHTMEIGTTKRNKVRTVDFCDTLAKILKEAFKQQQANRQQYGEMYHQNYYHPVQEKSRTYYEVTAHPVSVEPPESYLPVSFVCLKKDGSFNSPPSTARSSQYAAGKVEGMENFHFHLLRHTYTCNLLSKGAMPKDVQELLGHSDVSTTMNIYAHGTRENKRTIAKLLDQIPNEQTTTLPL